MVPLCVSACLIALVGGLLGVARGACCLHVAVVVCAAEVHGDLVVHLGGCSDAAVAVAESAGVVVAFEDAQALCSMLGGGGAWGAAVDPVVFCVGLAVPGVRDAFFAFRPGTFAWGSRHQDLRFVLLRFCPL